MSLCCIPSMLVFALMRAVPRSAVVGRGGAHGTACVAQVLLEFRHDSVVKIGWRK